MIIYDNIVMIRNYPRYNIYDFNMIIYDQTGMIRNDHLQSYMVILV